MRKMEALKVTSAAHTTFENYNIQAARNFLKTVVIVDNEPQLSGSEQKPTQAATRNKPPKKKTNAESLSAGTNSQPELDGSTDQDSTTESHALNIVQIVNAFAKEGMICGSYLPEKGTPAATIIDCLTTISRPADVLIFDWQLHEKEAEKEKHHATVEAVTKVLLDDINGGGRLRLIIIYTGEDDLENECGRLIKRFETAKIDNPLIQNQLPVKLNEKQTHPTLASPQSMIVFCNKAKSIGAHMLTAVPVTELPSFVLKNFSELSKGLLRSYALACISAIRNDTHRFLSQFDPKLDGAYVAQRISIPDPDEAPNMMRDIIMSDVASTIHNDETEKYLGADAATAWLDQSGIKHDSADDFKRFSEQQSDSKKAVALKSPPKYSVVKNALSTSCSVNSEKIGKKHLISLMYEQEADEISSSHTFSMLSLVARGRSHLLRPPHRDPVLSIGSLIHETHRKCYLLCIVPRCDSVRLDKDIQQNEEGEQSVIVRIPFIEYGITHDSPTQDSKQKPVKDFELVIPGEAGSGAIRLHQKPKSSALITLQFRINKGDGSIRSKKTDAGNYVFTAITGEGAEEKEVKWEWVADLHEAAALSIVNRFSSKLTRIGLNEFEWLRVNGGRAD